MGKNDHPQTRTKRRRRGWIVAGAIFALLVIFHRPILLGLIHWYAVHAAAKQKLKLEFRAEGNLFTAITIRNLHITPTGPNAPVEAADAGYIRAEYNLLALVRGDQADLINLIEVRDARFVINPQPAVKPSPPPREKLSLPTIFPQRLRLAGVSVSVRNHPADLAIDNLNLELNPRLTGELTIERLQLPSGLNWSNIAGSTSYANRNLVLRDLALSDRTKILLANLDASNIRGHTLGFRIDAGIDAASVSAQGQLTEESRSLRVKSQVAVRELSLPSLRQFGVLDEGPAGTVENVVFDFAGLLSSPKTWVSSGNLILRDLQVNGIALDRVSAQVSTRDGVALVQPVEVSRAGSVLQAHGTVQLPANAEELGRSPSHFEIAANNLDLAPITSAMPQPVTGRAQINGTLDVQSAQMQTNLKVSAGALSSGDIGLENLEATLSCAKDLRSSDVAWFSGMRTAATLTATRAHNRDLTLDAVSARVTQDRNRLSIDSATVQRGPNSIVATGSAQLQEKIRDVTRQPAQLSVVINLPQLADFWNSSSQGRVVGALSGYANVQWNGADAGGSFSLYGTGLKAQNLTIQQLSTAGAISGSTVFLSDLTASLNQRDFVNAHGTLDLRGDRKFTGKLAIDISDLATLKPLLEASGNKMALGGSFVLNWEGRGSFSKLTENGALKLNWNQGQLGNMKALQANVEATYSPAGLEMPTFFIGSDRMDFQAIASAKNETLEVSKIQLDQGNAKYAVGSVSVPFIWKNVGTSAAVFPTDGEVAATFETQNLDLKKMFDDFGVPPSASGFLTVKVQADGTLSDLRARLDVDARDLRNPKIPNLDPATFRLTADTAGKKLNIAGEFKQPRIQPVSIAATMHFDAGKVLSTGSLDENTPVNATVRLPPSSVNFLRQFVPAVEQLDGSVALDVAIGGTIARPVFSGSGDISINVARFTNTTLPALTGYQGRLVFRENVLTLEKFRGDLAGGPFVLGGRVVFTKLTQPNLDLTLRADSVLVARNDSLTARADADIKVTGPLTSAMVKGNVALTNSHFLKNIDIIPIGLPGRPAPEPPASRPTLSLPDPPLRDWKFDVTIKSKDPFLINGNLATGDAIIDLKLNGTGLHPGLQGQVRLENFDATLPFSTLTVQYGFLYFTPDDPLNPRIELHGTSLIRDYTINVYVYGTSLAPQAVFTSEPPLPQEEIISLLATGTTREELTGSGNVLATRAALLLVKQLYTKYFKKGQPTRNDSFLNRVDVEFGGTDQRTGKQTATAKFKVTDNILLVGDVGVAGDFRGQVKYLIRFR